MGGKFLVGWVWSGLSLCPLGPQSRPAVLHTSVLKNERMDHKHSWLGGHEFLAPILRERSFVGGETTVTNVFFGSQEKLLQKLHHGSSVRTTVSPQSLN